MDSWLVILYVFLRWLLLNTVCILVPSIIIYTFGVFIIQFCRKSNRITIYKTLKHPGLKQLGKPAIFNFTMDNKRFVLQPSSTQEIFTGHMMDIPDNFFLFAMIHPELAKAGLHIKNVHLSKRKLYTCLQNSSNHPFTIYKHFNLGKLYVIQKSEIPIVYVKNCKD